MLSFRWPALAGPLTGAGRRAENNYARRGRLYRWALVFALGVSLASASPIFFGLRLSGIWLGPLLLVLSLVLCWANLRGVMLMSENVPTSRPPVLRIALTVVLGLLVACSGTFWAFSGEVGTVQATGEVQDAKDAAQHLAAERATYLEILARPRPVVADDGEVVRLGRERDNKTRELQTAREQVVCEQDGNCGTRVPGEGPQYRLKVTLQGTLEGEFADLSRQLDAAKAAANGRLGDFDEDQRDARARIDELDRRSKDPVPVAAEKPSWLAAFFTVAERHPLLVAGVFLALLVLFGAVDHWLLSVVVRRVCRSDDGRPPIDEGLIAERRARAEGRRRAVPYHEYAADRPLSEGDGER